MTDAHMESPLRRFGAYGAVATLIAVIVLIGSAALNSHTTPKVGFNVSVKIADREVKAAGTTYLTDGAFRYEGSRLSFAGRIEGDQVSIQGKVTSPDRATTRLFKISAPVTGDRIRATVNGTDGRRIGTLQLELPSN